jgi:hypothetical protein
MMIGCGGGGGEGELVPVTGTVNNADGSAIVAQDGGKVLFLPDGSGRPATGSVEQDGAFTMMTEKPGDGVTPGEYKVVLQIMKDYRAGTLAVPEKYGDASTTPLEATVDADHTHFDFVVEP